MTGRPFDLDQYPAAGTCDALVSIRPHPKLEPTVRMEKPLPRSPMKRAISEHLARQADRATTIDDEHKMVRRLCDELEAIADALPRVPGEQQVLAIIAAVRAGIPAHCQDEEIRIRAWLTSQGATTTASTVAVERLASEHSDNDLLGQELAECLETVIETGRVANPEAVGLLIRHYFTAIRRHLMWEDFLLEHLLTGAR